MKAISCAAALLLSISCFSQKTYEDSIKLFLKGYVVSHEVVKGEDKKSMRFYPVNKSYRVAATFTPSSSTEWLTFKTSGTRDNVF